MSVATLGARHRAAVRPATPLTDMVGTATSQMAVVGRRSAAVVATSGVAIGLMGAAPAVAADGSSSIAGVDTSTVAEAVRAALDTAPVISSPEDATWTADVVAVTTNKPAAAPAAATRAAAKAAVKATANAVKTGNAVRSTASSAALPQAVAGNAVLEIAARYVGVPYKTGGATPAGFDCSGFVAYVYAQLGVDLPHSSTAIRGMLTVVSASAAQPGDIIWTKGHVAIYAGDGMEIDSPAVGKSIHFRGIWQSNPTFLRVD